MGKIRTAAIVLLAVVILLGCERKERIGLEYRDSAFECELSWERGGERIRAELVASSPSENRERDISLSFKEPEAMRGICVRKEGEMIWAELDGMRIDDGDMSGWIDIARIFDTDGNISYISSESVRGAECDLLKLERDDGEALSIHISRADGLPLRISGYGFDAEIIYFTLRTDK